MRVELAERVADQLRNHLPLARELPIDVEAVALGLGVDEVIRVDGLVEDKRLEQRDGHVRVLLASRGSAQRQRYTVAHEIGHLLLADPERDTIARRMRSDDDVERFCDDFAAALLLPRHLTRDEYRQRARGLATVRHLAARTNSSLAAATVRLNEVGGWSHALLHWKRGEHGWQFRWGAGVPVTFHRRLKSASNTSDCLEALGVGGRADQRADIPMLVGQTPMRLIGEASVRGRSAIALVRFRSMPGAARGPRSMRAAPLGSQPSATS